MVKRMVLGTQIKFPANLVRIRQDLSKLESYSTEVDGWGWGWVGLTELIDLAKADQLGNLIHF